MALMNFREPNQVLWQGVRPGHNGEQICVFNSVANGNAILYTVPVGQVYYLCSIWLQGVAGVISGLVGGYWYNAVPAISVQLMHQHVLAHTSWCDGHTYWPPIEIPASHSLRVYSAAAELTARLTIHGWVE